MIGLYICLVCGSLVLDVGKCLESHQQWHEMPHCADELMRRPSLKRYERIPVRYITED